MSSGVSAASCDSFIAFDRSRALSAIVSSYRSSLANSAAKRKVRYTAVFFPGTTDDRGNVLQQLYTLFLKRHLLSWLRLTSRHRQGEAAVLVADIYDAGIETMFGLDSIKQAADHKHDTALSEALEAAMKEDSESALRCLPRLFASYVQSVKRHKGALFSQGSNQAAGHITEQVQRATMVSCEAFVSLARMSTDILGWQCRVSLLETVETEILLSPKDEEAKALLRREGDMAMDAVADAWDGLYLQLLVMTYFHSMQSVIESRVPLVDCAVKVLAILTRIDYDLMTPSLALVYPKMMAVSSPPGSRDTSEES